MSCNMVVGSLDTETESGHGSGGVTEAHLIPTDDQRERLLTDLLAGGRKAPGAYLLCDLIGWLSMTDRVVERDAIVRRFA